MALDKTALLAAMALKKEEVAVGDGVVIVTELSADDYMAAYSSPLVKEGEEFSSTRFSALMAVRSMVNEEGERIMADEDAEAFRKGSSGVFRKITEAVNRVNGLTGEEAKN